MIDLRRLTVLRAIAEYGTVTAAAEAVHLTPSAVSQQVRQLGRELGVALLEPQGRRVRLTQAARGLLQHADAIEELWQRTEAELHATAVGEPSGVLRLAGFPSAASALLAPMAVRMQRTWPALNVQVREAEPLDSFALLFSGDTTSPSSRRRRRILAQRPALRPSAPAGRPVRPGTIRGSRAGRRPRSRVDDLAKEAWVLGMPGSGCSSRQLVLTACHSAGFAPAVAHQVREWSVVATLVSHGLGISLVPRLAQLPPDLDLVRTPLAAGSAPSRRFLSVTRQGSDGHPAIAAGLELLVELAAGLGRLGA